MSQFFFPLGNYKQSVRWFILGGLRLSSSTPSQLHLGLVFQGLLLEIPDLPEQISSWKEDVVAVVREMVENGEVEVRGGYDLPVSLQLRQPVL